ncbi:MAG: PQQ-binding-like beta-propeller repeat protein, partial [Ktedonobacteraceae bacterium]|nr:PQQ-binding-like beta-propeller repeat protein [Ktedonobacteraceae bacterium]
GCVPPTAGVASTATINTITIAGQSTSVLFIGGGNGTFYALNALTGKIIWSTPLGSVTQGYFLWSSPIFYQNSIYMGVSSEGDCPLIRGEVVKMDPASGAIQNIWYAVPQGCNGGGVWSTITVDQAKNMLYFGTGTADPLSCSTTELYAEAIVELNANDLSLVGSWKIPAAEQVPDGDIGSTVNLFNANIGGTAHNLVGVVGKNGIYYAFDRDNLNAGPLWRSPQVATSGDTLASTAWDGQYLYVAGHSTTYNGMNCEDSLRALNPTNGSFVWTTCLGGGQANCAIIAVPGLVVVGIGYRIYALSTITTATTTPGQVLFTYQEDQRGHDFYSVNILDGILYAGNVDGNFYAFSTAYNNVGISDDSNSSTANFDGGGYSYSAEALQAAGLTPGQQITANGITFTWPGVPAGVNDNYQANGQTIPITPVSGATTLAFLGSATNGPSSGTVTITYTDNSTQSFSLGFSDWTLNAGNSPPSFGNSVIATTSYRNHSGAGPDNVDTNILYAGVTLQTGKTLQSVTLPSTTNQGKIHVFAIATGNATTPTPTPPPAVNYNNAGISDDSNTTSANFDGGGYSYSAQSLQAAGITPGGSVTTKGVTFTWPNVASGVADNYQTNGQTIPVTPVSGATTLAFLGSATNGPSSGTATITYTNGSTQSFSLGFSDWTLNANTASASFGNAIAATLSYRNGANGRDNVNTYVFYADITLQAGKTLKSVTLPSTTNQGRLHVFAIATR